MPVHQRGPDGTTRAALLFVAALYKPEAQCVRDCSAPDVSGFALEGAVAVYIGVGVCV